MSKRALVALMAVCAVSAIAAASASAALPEFEGSFPKSYTESFGETHFVGVSGLGGDGVTCRSAGASGQITASKRLVESGLYFAGCYVTGTSWECETTGAAAGELQAEKGLEATLFYISKSKKEVGIVFNPKEANGFPPPPQKTFIPQFHCSSYALGEVGGSLTARVTPVNTKATLFSVSFRQASGKQEISEYENEKEEKEKESFWWSDLAREAENLGFESASTLGVAKAIEIKA